MNTAVYKSTSGVIDAMNRVYGHMSIAVLISMAVSYFVGTSPELLQFFFTGAKMGGYLCTVSCNYCDELC
jgi:FtsH-binding integral membrane protein